MLEELQLFGCDKVTETGIRHITDSSTMIHKLILAEGTFEQRYLGR